MKLVGIFATTLVKVGGKRYMKISGQADGQGKE